MFLNSVFFNKVSKIGFAVSISIEENIEEKINALPFLNVIIFQKNEKTVFIIIELFFFKSNKKKPPFLTVFSNSQIFDFQNMISIVALFGI